MNGYPVVRTDDILVHPRDGDLIVASHGRSLWIADDITPLQQWSPAIAAADATLFDVRSAVAYLNDFTLDIYTGGEKQFEGENPARGTAIQFWMKNAGDAKVSVADAAGRAVCETTLTAKAGINRVQWTLVAPMLALAPAAGGRGGVPPTAAVFPPSLAQPAAQPAASLRQPAVHGTASRPAPEHQLRGEHWIGGRGGGGRSDAGELR
jgi:hypothetical protein